MGKVIIRLKKETAEKILETLKFLKVEMHDKASFFHKDDPKPLDEMIEAIKKSFLWSVS